MGQFDKTTDFGQNMLQETRITGISKERSSRDEEGKADEAGKNHAEGHVCPDDGQSSWPEEGRELLAGP
jgi:hypothetical protein